MAFEIGTANGVDDFLDKLRIFAESLGCEILRWSESVDFSGKELCFKLHDSGIFHFYSDSGDSVRDDNPGPWIYSGASTSFNHSAGGLIKRTNRYFSPQPGGSPLTLTNGLKGPFSQYYFFGTHQYLHAVIEISPGIYAHISIGTLDKSFYYTGGEYVMGTFWNYSKTNNYIGTADSAWHSYPWDCYATHAVHQNQFNVIRCELPTPYWLNLRDNSLGGSCWGGVPRVKKGCPSYGIFHNSPSSFNGIAPLFPITNIARTEGERRYILGSPADIRLVNITHLVPGQSMHIGNDEWLIFPVKSKNGPVGEPSSGVYGLAYRKVL